MAFTDWDSNPANNTSKPGIDWSEGMLPSAVNNSSRQMMADLASWLVAPVLNGNTTVTGTVTASGAISSPTGVTSSSNVTATNGSGFASLTGNGDLQVYRSGGNTAFIYMNAAKTRYIQWDNTSYGFAGAPLSITGLSSIGAITTASLASSGAITQGGNQVWHAGNLNPSIYQTALGYTPANKAGDTFTGAIKRDANAFIDVTGSNADLTLGSGATFRFDRTASKWILYIGGSPVLSVDSGGVLRVSGNIIGSTTP